MKKNEELKGLTWNELTEEEKTYLMDNIVSTSTDYEEESKDGFTFLKGIADFYNETDGLDLSISHTIVENDTDVIEEGFSGKLYNAVEGIIL